MKRAERHHLKDNELAAFARSAREAIDVRRGQVGVILIVAAVVAAAAVGYFVWRDRVEGRAQTALAEALAVLDARVGPPLAPGAPSAGLSFVSQREKDQAAAEKFKAVADQYPNTEAGTFARYREAAIWMSLGNPKEAAAGYQRVIDRSGDNILGQMARLGLAEAQARSGQYDEAISTYKAMAERTDGELPTDGILMQLGRTYLDAGKPADAQQTFNRLIEEFPSSPFSGEARRELDSLKKT